MLSQQLKQNNKDNDVCLCESAKRLGEQLHLGATPRPSLHADGLVLILTPCYCTFATLKTPTTRACFIRARNIGVILLYCIKLFLSLDKGLGCDHAW